MPVIGMIGPHAVGKTTALKRWKSRYIDRLVTYSLDAERKRYPGNEEKQALVRECRASDKVCVIESARGFAGWLSVLEPSDSVIVLTTPEPVARLWWIERRGGIPLGDCWTPKRLDYECNRHLTNWVAKLAPGQSHHFVIQDRERDWKVVDECFARLFRKAHNRSLRSGREALCP